MPRGLPGSRGPFGISPQRRRSAGDPNFRYSVSAECFASTTFTAAAHTDLILDPTDPDVFYYWNRGFVFVDVGGADELLVPVSGVYRLSGYLALVPDAATDAKVRVEVGSSGAGSISSNGFSWQRVAADGGAGDPIMVSFNGLAEIVTPQSVGVGAYVIGASLTLSDSILEMQYEGPLS